MTIHTVRALNDNYCYLISNAGVAAVVDPSEAAPISTALRERGLKLGLILNTHHHHDHVGGNLELAQEWDCPIYCSEADFSRVPGATRAMKDAESFEFAGLHFSVLAIPGHTAGQIAYHIGDALFVGDTVFEMGCGRLFEGTAQQMFDSLSRIQDLPSETRLYFGHEYTETNARFAAEVEPSNSAAIHRRLNQVRDDLRARGVASAPTLAEERLVNPFFRAPTLEDFTRLRTARNSFS